jgi:PAS domain S-box-containing protein
MRGVESAKRASGGFDVPDFRALFEASPGLYLVLDPGLTIVAVTDAYLGATMTRREEIVGRHLFEVFPDNPDDPAATGVANLHASLDRVRSERVADTMAVQKYDIRRPDSEGGGFEERFWSPVNSPVLDADGRLTHIIHRVHDVTEFVRLKRAETEQQRMADELRSHAARMEAEVLSRAQEIAAANRALQRANAELDRFFSLSSDMFGVFNLDGTFRRVNAAWETTLGYRPGDLIGRPFLDLVHPDDRDRTIAEFRRATDEGTTTTQFENRYRHRDGSYRWLDWTGRLIPDEGVHYSAARDVTDRKRIEFALETARHDAERANLAKSEFLSRMSHELRTPLNAVLGFAQLLERDELSDDQRENVRYISRAGRHLLELINEVLDLSRIESGQMTISPEPVAVADLIEELIGLIKPMADGRSIALEASAAGCTAHVLADRQRLKQVLLNLLSNAVKYNREAGRMSVVCTAIDGRLRISVADSGYGIPADQLGRLFQPFERLTAAQSVEGTGMGLALSKGLVEAMGGTIGVDSELDRGTTFWIELGIAEDQVEAFENGRRRATPIRQDGPTRSVLHIEDNLSNLRLVERILDGRPDLAILTAVQGGLGVELARQHRPDLVLLDLHLPDLPGREVLRRLRTYPETRAIPIVVISADATKAQIAALTAAGAAGYLTKPLDVEEFLETVDRVLEAASPPAT